MKKKKLKELNQKLKKENDALMMRNELLSRTSFLFPFLSDTPINHNHQVFYNTTTNKFEFLDKSNLV